MKVEKPISDEECKKWWEEYSRNEYFTAFSWNFTVPELISMMKLTSDTKILEIGCGYGRELSQFATISKNCYGIDIAQGHVELTKKNVPSATINSYDGINIPYPDNSFDFAYSCYVIQHMSKDSALKLLIDLGRVLRPSGTALIEIFGGRRYEGEDGGDYSSMGKIGMMYNNAYKFEEIIEMFEKTDLKWQWIHIKNLEIIESTVKNYWIYAINKSKL